MALNRVGSCGRPANRGRDPERGKAVRTQIILALLITASAAAQSYSTNGDEQLAVYIARAVENNPAVRESFARYRSSLQRLPQVSALPDPMIAVTQFARSPETRVGPQTTMFSISQRFPWFGKLSDREKVAAKEAAVLAALHEADKAEVVRQVKRAYYDLAYVDTATGITNEDLELLRHYETLAQARYGQGLGLQQAVVKLQCPRHEANADGDRISEIFTRKRVKELLEEVVISIQPDFDRLVRLAAFELFGDAVVGVNGEGSAFDSRLVETGSHGFDQYLAPVELSE